MDPTTAEISDVVAIPVEQASSWEEGYQGSVKAKPLYDVECGAGSLLLCCGP